MVMGSGRKNRRGEIVDATIRFAAKQGVSGASIRQIASEAGVTEGAPTATLTTKMICASRHISRSWRTWWRKRSSCSSRGQRPSQTCYVIGSDSRSSTTIDIRMPSPTSC
ncbi:MAG: hypothetical protein CME13_12585 [Gemmatimonadetes bacterium]|nr:hypothetical protein [Gemmatimonadota bacterium]